jgi:class 3 adenylate cyclase
VPVEVAEATWRHLVTAPIHQLQQMRPWVLADRWGLPRGEVLAGLLRGIEDGLVELVWSVRCGRCHGQVASARVLSDIADHASCPSCRLGFGVDLGDNVEVLFAPHPGIVPRVDETFCTLFPAGAPDIHGAFMLPPGARVDETLALTGGSWRVGSGGELPDVRVHVREGGSDALEWSPEARGEIALAPGSQRLLASNPTTARHRLQVIRIEDGRTDFVAASALTTLPEFRRRMAHQVLSPDTRVSTRRVGLLFTDLSGSTALYDAVGDALAWAFVRDHFALLRSAVEAEGGHVVKTAGDAVMAAFDAGLPALRAGLAMQRAFETWVAQRELPSPVQLKVGVHVGPALVVHSDAWGLDWFGQAVNVAARVQGRAAAGEITWSDEVQEEAGVTEHLSALGATPEAESASLKGVAAPMRLWHLRPRAGAREGP